MGNIFTLANSIKGFFGSGYYCLRCEQKYDRKDFLHHHCPGLTCYACHQDDCEDQKKVEGAHNILTSRQALY